jgi:hypothetical protein
VVSLTACLTVCLLAAFQDRRNEFDKEEKRAKEMGGRFPSEMADFFDELKKVHTSRPLFDACSSSRLLIRFSEHLAATSAHARARACVCVCVVCVCVCVCVVCVCVCVCHREHAANGQAPGPAYTHW